MHMRVSLILSLLSVLALAGCSNYTPKPHGYPKIDFPERSYTLYDDGCAYTFKKPTYAVVVPDTHERSEPCWYNIHFPNFGATVYLSYKSLEHPDQLDSLADDAFKLAGKNQIRADAIEEIEIETQSGNKGIVFELFGPSATPFNFYISDEKKHYLRGSFYFDNHTKTDSVAPVYEFLKEDFNVLINSVEWRH